MSGIVGSRCYYHINLYKLNFENLIFKQRFQVDLFLKVEIQTKWQKAKVKPFKNDFYKWMILWT